MYQQQYKTMIQQLESSVSSSSYVRCMMLNANGDRESMIGLIPAEVAMWYGELRMLA
jgi:hypothetical protein